jgi:3'(2'), 5'-bisphosphate nucleotidase
MKDKGLRVVSSRSHLDAETQQFIDALNQPETLSRGSALKFMLIASGAAHLYPRIAPTMEWDTAAAQCIVEEAGGFVQEFESRMPLRYNKETLVNPAFLAGGLTRPSP